MSVPTSGAQSRGARPALAPKIIVPGFPHAIDVAPTGANAFVTSRRIGPDDSGGMAILDLAQGAVGTVVQGIGDAPEGIACKSDESAVYVTDVLADKVTVLEPNDGSILKISIPVGAAPNGIALTPDGSKAVVTNSSPLGASLSVIDTTVNEAMTRIPLDGILD